MSSVGVLQAGRGSPWWHIGASSRIFLFGYAVLHQRPCRLQCVEAPRTEKVVFELLALVPLQHAMPQHAKGIPGIH